MTDGIKFGSVITWDLKNRELWLAGTVYRKGIK